MTTIPEFFGSNVFSRAVMKERLPKKVYAEVVNAMENGGQISMATADVVADAMKNWAVEKGATHYCHWFQPLTGSTAEKHDAFLTLPDEDGHVLLQLSGKKLIMGEPDASSFPNGGLRATSYARGYTAWDMTSPAFVKEESAGTILCIPTVFVSYTGEALDGKTPLLRSMEAVSKEAIRILRLFGNTAAKKVTAFVGPEQEYFLVDREKYLKRRDLIYTGRTLFGAPAPKGQELDDHYFGTIKPRVMAYMKELDEELWRRGVMAKTEHNEVAPAQHELAPFFTTTNIAADGNQLTMELMQRLAQKHGMVCLLAEKPFAGVNGSGKHNNWSLVTDTGRNLLDGGSDPANNLTYLLMLAAVMTAVDEYQALLRITVATAGNDHRLGASEAPPAILSIFLGEALQNTLMQAACGEGSTAAARRELEMRVPVMPHLRQDDSDRNRTSPFAFTGNKFEFRMLGSSQSISDPNTVLNTAVAEVLGRYADRLEQSADREDTVRTLLQETLEQHGRILFNGDGYSEEWQREAERRGLLNLRTAPEAFAHLTEEKNVALFAKHGIFTAAELTSRQEIHYETYAKCIRIEAATMAEMVRRQILPAGQAALRELGQTSRAKQEISPLLSCKAEELLGTQIANYNDMLLAGCTLLENLLRDFPSGTEEQKALYARDRLLPAMNELRQAADALEQMCPAHLWPMPTYGELLYGV